MYSLPAIGAAAAGANSALLVNRLMFRRHHSHSTNWHKWDMISVCNGLLAGLVAVTAG